MFLGKKERAIENLILEFFLKVRETLPELIRLLDDYLKGDRKFKEDARQVHVREHEADEIRRDIMNRLYQGAFLPFYREDYIILTILGDGIANQAESVASFLVLTRPEIPDFLHQALRDTAGAALEMFEPLKEMLECGFRGDTPCSELTRKIRDREQGIDRLQWETIKALFKSRLPLAEKLHLKDLVDGLAQITDRIQTLAERFEVMMVKRPV